MAPAIFGTWRTLCPGLATCRTGCRAAAKVCFGSLEEPEPWLRAKLERLPSGATPPPLS